MERPLPLEISGAASRNDAYADVVSWVHRDADEGIRCGCAAHGSLRRSRWHHHRGDDALLLCGRAHELPRFITWYLRNVENLPMTANNGGGVVTPSVSNAPVAPQGLLDVVSCSCSAEREPGSENRCSCHSAGLSCTEYCYCEGEMRVAVPSISTHKRINCLKICRKTRERLTMMNDLRIDGLLVSTNCCYCWN